MAAEPHQPSTAQRPVTWDLWLMLSVNNMDLLKESIEMPSEIRARQSAWSQEPSLWPAAVKHLHRAHKGMAVKAKEDGKSPLPTGDVSAAAFPLAFN